MYDHSRLLLTLMLQCLHISSSKMADYSAKVGVTARNWVCPRMDGTEQMAACPPLSLSLSLGLLSRTQPKPMSWSPAWFHLGLHHRPRPRYRRSHALPNVCVGQRQPWDLLICQPMHRKRLKTSDKSGTWQNDAWFANRLFIGLYKHEST